MNSSPEFLTSRGVDLEKSLDSFIRLLFNSVFDKLFDFYGFDYEFYESNIFSGLFEPTKEYEMRISYEFLVKKDGKYIGFRYSNLQDKEVIDLVSNYTQYKMFIDKMDGFEKGPICKLCILDFNDRLGEFKYDKNERPIPYLSLKEFLNTFFSDIDYVEFYNKINSAIRSTNDILAMQVTPKLLSNNIFKFKKKVSDSFVSCIHSLKYVFKENTRFCTLNSEVNEFAFADLFEVEKCIIGNSDFSKCFISAEYLFSVIGGNLKLDFTPIVLGYIKSIEQLLYVIYDSAFKKNKTLSYWRREEKPTINCEEREDPFDSRKSLYKYPRKKKEESKIELMELFYFIANNSFCWKLDENQYKEIIMQLLPCFKDYSQNCRNNYLHKDNLYDYAEVLRIRNNTMFILYYLLTLCHIGWDADSKNSKLGIVDDTFDRLYLDVVKERGYYSISLKDSVDIKGFWIDINNNPKFNEDGYISDGELHFLKYEGEYVNDDILKDDEYIKNNSIVITRENCPLEYKKMKDLKHRPQ